LDAWHVWLIIAIGLFIAEIFVPGFVLGSFGIGCLFSALAALFDMHLKIQLVTFSVLTLATFFAVRPIFLKYFYSPASKIQTNIDALVGKTGLVSEKIDPDANKGRVIVGGEDWRAVSADGNWVEEGEKVKVVSVEGTKLFVRTISHKSSAGAKNV
jgi:membrane protein implicated in regulation of membrane protease activity